MVTGPPACALHPAYLAALAWAQRGCYPRWGLTPESWLQAPSLQGPGPSFWTLPLQTKMGPLGLLFAGPSPVAGGGRWAGRRVLTGVGARNEPEAAVLHCGILQRDPHAQHPAQGLRVQEGGVLVRGDCSRPLGMRSRFTPALLPTPSPPRALQAQPSHDQLEFHCFLAWRPGARDVTSRSFNFLSCKVAPTLTCLAGLLECPMMCEKCRRGTDIAIAH